MNVDEYYSKCCYDYCASDEGATGEAACGVFADYAKASAEQGEVLNWMEDIPECGT